LACFRGLRSIRSRKIAKNFRPRDRWHFFGDFSHGLESGHPAVVESRGSSFRRAQQLSGCPRARA
jgi:hypothetical protein